MPWGKHRDRPIRDLPATYLHWLTSLSDLRDDLARQVRGELRRRGIRFVAAHLVLAAIEDDLLCRLHDDLTLSRSVAGAVGDHLQDAIDSVRAQFGVGDGTELLCLSLPQGTQQE